MKQKILMLFFILVLTVSCNAQDTVNIMANWNRPIEPIEVTNYNVQVFSDVGSGFSSIPDYNFVTLTNDTFFIFEALDKKTYKGRVRALNENGYGEWSNEFIELTVGTPGRCSDIQLTGDGKTLRSKVVFSTISGLGLVYMDIYGSPQNVDVYIDNPDNVNWQYRYKTTTSSTNPCPTINKSFSSWVNVDKSQNQISFNTNNSLFPGWWTSIVVQVRVPWEDRELNDYDDEECAAYIP